MLPDINQSSSIFCDSNKTVDIVDIFVFVSLELLSICGLVGNGLLITTIISCGHLQKPSFALFVSLSVADIVHVLVTGVYFNPPILLRAFSLWQDSGDTATTAYDAINECCRDLLQTGCKYTTSPALGETFRRKFTRELDLLKNCLSDVCQYSASWLTPDYFGSLNCSGIFNSLSEYCEAHNQLEITKFSYASSAGVIFGRLANTLDWTAWGVTLSHMGAICLDRLLAITLLHGYGRSVTRKRYVLFSFSSWVFFGAINTLLWAFDTCCPIVPFPEGYTFGYLIPKGKSNEQTQQDNGIGDSYTGTDTETLNSIAIKERQVINIYQTMYVPIEVATMILVGICTPVTVGRLIHRYRRNAARLKNRDSGIIVTNNNRTTDNNGNYNETVSEEVITPLNERSHSLISGPITALKPSQLGGYVSKNPRFLGVSNCRLQLNKSEENLICPNKLSSETTAGDYNKTQFKRSATTINSTNSDIVYCNTSTIEGTTVNTDNSIAEDQPATLTTMLESSSYNPQTAQNISHGSSDLITMPTHSIPSGKRTTFNLKRRLTEAKLATSDFINTAGIRKPGRPIFVRELKVYTQICVVTAIFFAYMATYYTFFYGIGDAGKWATIFNTVFYSITHIINPLVILSLNEQMRRDLRQMVSTIRCTRIPAIEQHRRKSGIVGDSHHSTLWSRMRQINKTTYHSQKSRRTSKLSRIEPVSFDVSDACAGSHINVNNPEKNDLLIRNARFKTNLNDDQVMNEEFTEQHASVHDEYSSRRWKGGGNLSLLAGNDVVSETLCSNSSENTPLQHLGRGMISQTCTPPNYSQDEKLLPFQEKTQSSKPAFEIPEREMLIDWYKPHTIVTRELSWNSNEIMV